MKKLLLISFLAFIATLGIQLRYAPSVSGVGCPECPVVGGNNFSDIMNTSSARTALGLGDAATLSSSTWTKMGTINSWTAVQNFTTTTVATGLSVGTTTIPTNGAAALFRQVTSSTIYIGGNNSGGCIVLGDSANGGLNVFITATGGTLTATTTKPKICR